MSDSLPSSSLPGTHGSLPRSCGMTCFPVLRITACVVCGTFAVMAFGNEPLPSWRETQPKQALLNFVEEVTKAGSAGFVPQAERLAVFDNDGTLWPECPLPAQLAYVIDEVKRLAQADPELDSDPMVQAAVKGDLKALLAGEKHDGLVKVLALTHVNMTASEFGRRVDAWYAAAEHPRFKKQYSELAYKPMLEVLEYLRANDFKIAIVSGGGVDFMRQFAEKLYGIEPEWVLGSSADVVFEIKDERPVFLKQATGLFVNDKVAKSIRIFQQLGRRPIACFGNSDGDQSMLEYTTIGNPHPSFGMLVHHTDADREYAYDKNPPASGRLVSALAEAEKRDWVVVDMKRDWTTVFGNKDHEN